MNAPRNCPGCNAELPTDAPLGLCPACLFQQAAAPDDQPMATEAATPPERFQAPSPESLSAQFPHLEVLELLGRGGMGAVYKARQTMLDRLVALKILLPELSNDPTFAERFVREAGALAKLSHPNLVTVYDFGETNGLYWLLMEYVDGENLRDAIRRRRLTPAEAIEVIPQICEALQYAHDEGVVHRDIKPENILLDRRGRVHIADFGLAKLLGRSPVEVTLTATHQVMGTLHYMAPEQMERPLEVDHRADIYSLGVVFYELLTGELPLGRYKLPSEKQALDSRLDNVVMKTLEREPNERYQHASDVKIDIESIQRVEPPIPARVPAATRSRVVSVPMALSKQGMNFGNGVARFDGERVELEFEIDKTWAAHPALAGFDAGVHDVSVPIDELHSIRFESGWLVNSLFLQANSMRSVSDIPGAVRAQVKMAIAKRDIPAAEEFVRVVEASLGETHSREPATVGAVEEPALGAAPLAAKPGVAPAARPGAEADGHVTYVTHPGKIAMGVVMMLMGAALVTLSLTNHSHDGLLWVGIGVIMGGGGVMASGARSKLQVGWKLIGINWGVILMGMVMIGLGSVLFASSLLWNRGNGGLLWVGFGIVMGGGGCLAGGWTASQTDHHYRLSDMAATQFVMGCVMILVGVGMMVTGWLRLGPNYTFLWIGMGLTMGGGGCWSSIWKKKTGPRPDDSRGWTSLYEDRKPAKPETMLSLGSQRVRQRVRVPAAGLLTIGMIHCVVFLGLLALGAASFQGNFRGSFGLLELLLIGGPACLVGIGLVGSALQMFTMRNHTLSMVGAALAVMPLSPLWFLSVGFGIWALMVLNSEEVKREFDLVAEQSRGW